MRSCKKDGGRPAGIGCQEQILNHFKLLALRVLVMSFEVKHEETLM
jgi:hypothetical protein